MSRKFLFSTRNGVFMALALTAAGAAQAHTGHTVTGFMSGLAHPFGLDHLLAMVAVGVWSSLQLSAGKVWQGPAAFMACLLAGAMAGMAGWGLPQGELLIALSVVALGAMVVAIGRMPVLAGFSLIALSASLHGLAHGAEAPGVGYAGYAAGFLVTTAALHVLGACAGWLVRNRLSQSAVWLTRSAGVVCAGMGCYLASQI
jgi:urease accessory protein